MKGIKSLTAVGIFIILTSIICFADKEIVYEKKIRYNSPEEIIEVLNTKVLNGYEMMDKIESQLVNTDDFKECLSKRKRITGSLVDFETLNLEVEENYDEEKIIDDYKRLANQLVDYKIEDKIKAYSLTGTYESVYKECGQVNMQIVFIDEGEGYVIDYIVSTYGEDLNKKRME